MFRLGHCTYEDIRAEYNSDDIIWAAKTLDYALDYEEDDDE